MSALTGGTADDPRPPESPLASSTTSWTRWNATATTAATTSTPTAPVGLIGDLACIYEGTQDHPAIAYPRTVPPPPPAYPGPSGHDAVALTRADASTVFAALDIAADDKRYRVEMCPDCPDQSCLTCQTHIRDAQAFDQMADRMLQALEAAPAASASWPGPDRRSQPAADREAGQ